MLTGHYGLKKMFEVASDKIYTPKGTAFTEEMNFDETEVSKRKGNVNFKGVKLSTVSFELKLDSRFVDVEKEISFWQTQMLSKKSELLYIGVHKFPYCFVTKCELKDFVLNSASKLVSAVLSLSFTEDGETTRWFEDAPAREKAAAEAAKKKAEEEKQAAKKQAATVTAQANKNTIETKKIKKGSTIIIPKNNARWYDTALNAVKKTGTSGKAYHKEMKVTHTALVLAKKYNIPKDTYCVNPQGLGWLVINDIEKVVKY